MYIGELAKRTGASPKAIRHYEALGLLGTVPRAGTYRLYSMDHVRQILLIRQALSLGLRLADVLPVLGASRGAPNWSGLLDRIGRRQALLREEIERLRGFDLKLSEISFEIRACLQRDSEFGDCGVPAMDRSEAA